MPEIGLGAKSFTYATVVQLVGAIGSSIAIALTDRTGRRPLVIIGAVGLIIFNMIIAGLGGSSKRSTASNNMVVASFILMIFSTKVSWATHCFLIASELGGLRMRKKIMMMGTSTDVVSAWLVSFCSPYIMNKPYGGIGGKIGYIFAGLAIVSLFFAIFIVPELKVRSYQTVTDDSRVHWKKLTSYSSTSTGDGSTSISRPLGMVRRSLVWSTEMLLLPRQVARWTERRRFLTAR